MKIEKMALFSTAEISGFTHLDTTALSAIKKQYGLRRADRYSTLLMAAANHILHNLPAHEFSDTAIITVTAFGPHKTTFEVLDDILDFPEDQILPQRFSHSVHNAAASYISTAFKLHGPIYAVAGFEDVFFSAMQLAQSLLLSQQVSKVFLVGADELALLTESLSSLWKERFPETLPENMIALLLSQGNHGADIVMDDATAQSSYFHFGCSATFISEYLANPHAQNFHLSKSKKEGIL